MNTLFTDVFDDMFEQLNAMFNSRAGDHSLNTYGLKHVIKRPHNLYTIKDNDGHTNRREGERLCHHSVGNER